MVCGDGKWNDRRLKANDTMGIVVARLEGRTPHQHVTAKGGWMPRLKQADETLIRCLSRSKGTSVAL